MIGSKCSVRTCPACSVDHTYYSPYCQNCDRQRYRAPRCNRCNGPTWRAERGGRECGVCDPGRRDRASRPLGQYETIRRYYSWALSQKPLVGLTKARLEQWKKKEEELS